MLQRTNVLLLISLLGFSPALPAFAQHKFLFAASTPKLSLGVVNLNVNDREHDGLSGPVRRVRTETAKISTKAGKPVEGARAVLETATYDIKGGKIDSAYFLAASSALTGKEVYKYDDKGNIVEMTLHNSDGSVLSKEVYSYEFDAMGNWTKMVTSVAIIEGGQVTYEPTEVTYRLIAYFLEDNVAKMVQTAAANTAPVSSQKVPATPNPTPPQQKSSLTGAPPPIAQVAINKTVALPSAGTLNKANVMAISPAAVNNGATFVNNSGANVAVEGEAPSKPMMRGPLKPISGGLLNGRATSLPMPAYPEIAKRTRLAGTVAVEVVVDATGKVLAAKAVSGPAMLHQAAEKAALQARFTPTLLSGQPVRVAGMINYNFSLK